ncbi:MAG: hypothetical protein ABI910_18985 [Gemmatimonadota bacterium]
MKRAALQFAALCLLQGATACADFAGTSDPTFGLSDTVVDAPTLFRDVQPIFDRRCAYGGCHSAATHQAGLTLVAGASRDALLGRPARLSPGDTLVVAGDSARSWILRMIGDNDIARGGFSRMPLASSPLTANQRETIARWIARGASED